MKNKDSKKEKKEQIEGNIIMKGMIEKNNIGVKKERLVYSDQKFPSRIDFHS